MWLLLLQVKRCPQSSKAWPNCPPPEVASKRRAVGLEPEVAAPDRDGLVVRPRRVADVAAVAPRDAVDPAVEAPLEAVHERLDVLGAEPGEDDLLLVGHAVAVGVPGVQDVRGHRDEDPAVVGQHARRPRQAVDEDRAPLEDAVAVAVFEPADVAGGRVLGVRISAHLDHVDPAVGVVDEAHRVGHDRLRRHRLEAEPLVQAERLQGVARFEGLDPGQFPGQVVSLAASGDPSQAGPEEHDEQREAMRHGEILPRLGPSSDGRIVQGGFDSPDGPARTDGVGRV